MRRAAVREIGVSRHHGGRFMVSTQVACISRLCGTEGFQERLQFVPHYAGREYIKYVSPGTHRTRKKTLPLSERLAFLGIMGVKFKTTP